MATTQTKTAHVLPDLPYDFNALEPYIDELTMQIHHGKHHNTYVSNLNKALEGYPDLAGKPIDKVLTDINSIPEGIHTAVVNNGGGHFNHSVFWTILGPPGQGGGQEPSGKLSEAINSTFGDFEQFKLIFSNAAATRFGSGWAWLVVDHDHKLQVYSTANQDSPVSQGHFPLLTLDVWEHAYYLKYRNRRPDYISAWWNVVNWNAVAERFNKAT